MVKSRLNGMPPFPVRFLSVSLHCILFFHWKIIVVVVISPDASTMPSIWVQFQWTSDEVTWQWVSLNAFRLGLIYSNTFEITLRHLFGQELKLGKGRPLGNHRLSHSIEESGMCTPESIQLLSSGLPWYFQQWQWQDIALYLWPENCCLGDVWDVCQVWTGLCFTVWTALKKDPILEINKKKSFVCKICFKTHLQ